MERRTPLRRKVALRRLARERAQAERKPTPPLDPPARWCGNGMEPELREKARVIGKPPGRREDGDYRAFVRSKPCLSCGATEDVEASHHGPRPVGRKADDSWCVPLCAYCHRLGPGNFHRTGKLPGWPLLEGDGLRVFLMTKMIELLTEHFWGNGPYEQRT